MFQDAEISQDMVTRYAEDGVIVIKKVLESRWIDLLEAGLARNIRSPGPCGTHSSGIESIDKLNEFKAIPGEFWHDSCSFERIPEYQRALYESPIMKIFAKLMESDEVWLYYDQIFLKQGPSRRTPWHQDSPYHVIDGPQVATMWIPLTPVGPEEALEYVIGSHVGQMYDGSTFEAGNDTAPYFGGGVYPQLPDIEMEREKWPITAFPVDVGDVLVFHPNTLHGGGRVLEGRQRRTFAVRVFGRDAYYVEKPGQTLPPLTQLTEVIRDGGFPSHPTLPRLWPRTSSINS